MRRYALLFLFVLSATLLVAGAALAVNMRCPGDCKGTTGNDRLVGSPRNNRIQGASGNDNIYGRGGADELKGGTGRDAVYGQLGDDRVKGSFGPDRVFGGDGNDLVRGGTARQTNDGAQDFLDCGPGMADEVFFVPDQDEIRNCEIRNPPTPGP